MSAQKSAIRGYLVGTFKVQPGEGVYVALMILYSAAAVGGILTVGYNGVGEALFLSRLPASDVPFTLILPAIAIVLALWLYNLLAARIWFPHLAVASSIVRFLST